MPDKHEVGGSSPLGPTISTQRVEKSAKQISLGEADIINHIAERYIIKVIKLRKYLN